MIGSVYPATEALPELRAAYPFTYYAVVREIGEDCVARMAAISSDVVRHQFHTGEMTGQLLWENGCSSYAQYLGYLAGGLHDYGKLTRRDILSRVVSGRVFDPYERKWVSEEHSAEGGRQLRQKTHSKTDSGAPRQPLDYAVFTAVTHHGSRPENYDALPSELALAHGITDCIQALDPLQAVYFDSSRSYVSEREGRRTPAKVLGIVEQERGRPWHDPPIVEGVKIDLKSFVAKTLGLARG